MAQNKRRVFKGAFHFAFMLIVPELKTNKGSQTESLPPSHHHNDHPRHSVIFALHIVTH